MNVRVWLDKNTRSLVGKRVAVTGATGGSGRELCRYLLTLGASLCMLDRSKERSDALRAALEQEFPKASILQIPLDLSDMASVRTACDALEQAVPDVLIHNAGAYSIPRCRCDTGLDNVFQINFASPYYMTRRLLPHMKKRKDARVVAVGSIAHRYSNSDPDDVDFRTRRAASLVYGNAKRYLMFALHTLFEDESEVTLSVVHPGITFTGITAHYPNVLFAVIKHPMKWIFMPPRVACLSVLKGVFEKTPQGTWIGPQWFDVWGRPKLRRLRSYTEQESFAIAARAERMYLALDGSDGDARAAMSVDWGGVNL